MQQIVSLPTRRQHLRRYLEEVWDHMNGGSFKRNEDGSYSATFTRIKPDKIANAVRRTFYLALTAVLGLVAQQVRSTPQAIQDAFGPKAFAAYLKDPEVKAAFSELLREIVTSPAEAEKETIPKTKPTKRTTSPPRRPEPSRLNLYREDGLIANPTLPTYSSMRPPEFPPMRRPD